VTEIQSDQVTSHQVTNHQEAPWFEDFTVGDDFSMVPSVTITEGFAAIHQAIFGDRLRLPLDHHLSKQVTSDRLVNPSLLCNLAIGQSTFPSQRVMGNLFYRGLIIHKPVFLGDTIKTKTKVVALRQNSLKPGRAASGMVALQMHVINQKGETVMLFWRCPMIPCKDKEANTGHLDSFDFMPAVIEMSLLEKAIPSWNTNEYKKSLPGIHFKDIETGNRFDCEARDTITLAPELVRLTLNMAMTHTDAQRSVYGKRLVYGGHTISMAAAQISRVLPNMVTILAWFTCDHVAPVFEEDILRSEVTIQDTHPLDNGGIVTLHIESFVTRINLEEGTREIKVLDWVLAAFFA
jgi:2-methylfumaryl-CoA hydratase